MIYLCLFTAIVVGVFVADHITTVALLNSLSDSVLAELQTLTRKEESDEITSQS